MVVLSLIRKIEEKCRVGTFGSPQIREPFIFFFLDPFRRLFWAFEMGKRKQQWPELWRCQKATLYSRNLINFFFSLAKASCPCWFSREWLSQMGGTQDLPHFQNSAFFYCGVLSSWRGEPGAESQGRKFHPFLLVFYLPSSVSVGKNELLHFFPTNNWYFGDFSVRFNIHACPIPCPFLPDVFLIISTLQRMADPSLSSLGSRKNSEFLHFSLSLCAVYRGDCREVLLFPFLSLQEPGNSRWKQLKYKSSSDSLLNWSRWGRRQHFPSVVIYQLSFQDFLRNIKI